MSEDCICFIEESSDTFLIPSLLILVIDVKFQMFGGLSLSVSVCVFFLPLMSLMSLTTLAAILIVACLSFVREIVDFYVRPATAKSETAMIAQMTCCIVASTLRSGGKRPHTNRHQAVGAWVRDCGGWAGAWVRLRIFKQAQPESWDVHQTSCCS